MLVEGTFDEVVEYINQLEPDISDWEKLPYWERAWRLGQIMIYMNNEEAYYNSGWLYIWPDGETQSGCKDDFDNEESYKDLERSFRNHYSDAEYHGDGLYGFKGVPLQVVEDAHLWDKILNLKPIEVIK